MLATSLGCSRGLAYRHNTLVLQPKKINLSSSVVVVHRCLGSSKRYCYRNNRDTDRNNFEDGEAPFH